MRPVIGGIKPSRTLKKDVAKKPLTNCERL